MKTTPNRSSLPASPRLRVAASLLFFATALLSTTTAHAQPATQPAPADTFTLWQLPNQTNSQIMSYVIRTQHGKLIVIDGGVAGDSLYLKGFIAALGNDVHTWFISHAHNDHFGALGQILLQADRPRIQTVCGSLPSPQWVRDHGVNDDAPEYEKFLDALNKADLRVRDLKGGEYFKIDGIAVEVLGIRNPEITVNAINNSSLVWRMSDSRKSILFLADLGEEGGRKLLKPKYPTPLHADYLQMAHHGQNGVDEEFYRAVNPKYCLWPTPLWLWDNDKGQGKDSGPWQTLKVRAWMDKLPIQQHYVMTAGLIRID